jgi:predicted permease
MRLHRALLHLYPAAFRLEYGDEMCAVFAQRWRDTSGALGTLGLWLRVFVDVLVNAALVHGDILTQDLRYTARTLSRAPGFTFTAIVVAALGVGANTAAFTMVDHVFIRPLPFSNSERLVNLYQHETSRGYTGELSPANYRSWKRMSASFDAMAAHRGLSVNLVGQGDPERIDGASVTADLFPMLGVHAALGRIFTTEEDRDGATGTVLLSHGLWQGMFAGDPGVLGRRVILDDALYVIIGVMPRSFHFPNRDCELWTAMRFAPRDYEDRTDTYIHVTAKLKPTISLEQSRAEMGIVTAQLERAYPRENAKIGATVIRLRDEVSGQSRWLLMALFGAALCVLLIACTNLANLMLARALARSKELAVRTAMGAGRERLIRQLLTESLILALCGGVLGVFVAGAALPLLARLVPISLPIAQVPALDWRVFTFAALLAALAGIGFGVVPALRICGGKDISGLHQGSRSGVGGRKERLRSALVIAEVTGSMVLLISSGLLIRALWRIQSTDPGFRTEGVLTLRTSLPMPKYEKTALREQFYSRVLSEANRLAGVSSAAYISFLPMVMRGGIWPVAVPGGPQDPADLQKASLRFVTPGFFAALAIPLHRGRDVSESDTRNSPFVAVVSESFVRRYWPDQNPLGRGFKIGFFDRTIVGVVGDIHVRGLERSSEPQVYLPYKQVPDGGVIWYAPKDLVVRSTVNAATLVPALRGIIRTANPEQPVSDVRMLGDIVEAETAPRVVQVRVLGAFAAIAFLLAAIGMHGLLSFAVSNRMQEIGVRMALGAQRSDILAMVLRDGVRLAAVGTVLGVSLAYGAGRTMQSLLAGVKPGDALTFATAIGLALLMTLVGTLIPALRAVRVDPTMVIRTE